MAAVYTFRHYIRNFVIISEINTAENHTAGFVVYDCDAMLWLVAVEINW
jgi:hypothetical protein